MINDVTIGNQFFGDVYIYIYIYSLVIYIYINVNIVTANYVTGFGAKITAHIIWASESHLISQPEWFDNTREGHNKKEHIFKHIVKCLAYCELLEI